LVKKPGKLFILLFIKSYRCVLPLFELTVLLRFSPGDIPD